MTAPAGQSGHLSGIRVDQRVHDQITPDNFSWTALGEDL